MTDAELTAMLENDEHHWWYRGRRQVLRAVLDTLDLPENARLLDAGCGSGRTLDELVGDGRVTGVDQSVAAVTSARARGHEDVHVAVVEDMPFEDATFDLVTCLDVIEHTPDHHATLAELLRVTRPDGLLVVTVPAYPALWSAHDVANRHYRRYRAATLRAAATEAGWTTVSDTHFNSMLLAPAALVRLARRGARSDPDRSELSLTPRAVDRVLELPMRCEAALIGGGVRLPFGLSLLAVLRRPLEVVAEARPRGGAGRPGGARSARRVTTHAS